jgi:hypothetical protein
MAVSGLHNTRIPNRINYFVTPGRKRKAGQREPNGDIQRRARLERREDMTAVVLEARQRVFSVSAKQAKDMPEPTFLGRLIAMGQISQEQYNAATNYQEASLQYDSLHLVRRVAAAGDLDRGGGHDGSDGTDDAYLRRFRYWRDRFLRFERALNETASQDAHAPAVTRNVVLHGFDMPHFVGSLRIGLNGLERVT